MTGLSIVLLSVVVIAGAACADHNLVPGDPVGGHHRRASRSPGVSSRIANHILVFPFIDSL